MNSTPHNNGPEMADGAEKDTQLYDKKLVISGTTHCEHSTLNRNSPGTHNTKSSLIEVFRNEIHDRPRQRLNKK